jgi:hypothetical protein
MKGAVGGLSKKLALVRMCRALTNQGPGSDRPETDLEIGTGGWLMLNLPSRRVHRYPRGDHLYCGRGGRALAMATSRPQEISSGEQSSRSIMHSISVGPS